MDKNSLQNIRKEYGKAELNRKSILKNPIEQLKIWLQEAIDENCEEPNAMVLSTVNENGQPSSRVVLLREITANSILFYTNYNSKKGQQILKNPQVCANIFWPKMQRQIRLEGLATKVSEEKSNQYFNARPALSRLASMASPQSKIIDSKTFLINLFEAEKQKHKSGKIERPKHWGGFQIELKSIEFWQGGLHRLHDRLLFEKQENDWILNRLAP